MLQPGQMLLGKYRVERTLGQGGMGSVALARHVHLGTPVAIKFLRPEFLAHEMVVKRFLREAQAAARLQGEHVCRVSDVGTLDDGAPYMVMEYMDGMDLRELARAHGPLAPGVVVDFVLEACEALAEAHAQQIVHRDLKPANLFVARLPDGTSSLKVLDFGISKAHSAVDEEITHTHTVLGTPAYMSPEQMRSAKHADARSDIWSLGVILFELLHGARPFQGQAFSELCLRVNMDPTPPMRAGLPAGLEEVVRRCLEKDPGLRFQNVAELAAALARFAATGPTADTAVSRATRLLGVAPAWPMPANRAATAQPWSVDSHGPPTTLGAGSAEVGRAPERPRRTGWLVALAAIVLLGVGVGVGVGLRGTSQDKAAAGEGAAEGVAESVGDTAASGLAREPGGAPDSELEVAPGDAPPATAEAAGADTGAAPDLGTLDAATATAAADEPADEDAADQKATDDTKTSTAKATAKLDKKTARSSRDHTRKAGSTDIKSGGIEVTGDTKSATTDTKPATADTKPATADTKPARKAYGLAGSN